MNKNDIKILLYSGNLWYFAEGMLGPLLAIFTQRIGGDVLDISWAWAIYLTFYGVLTIYFGKISDRYNKRLLLFIGYALNALLTFLYIYVSSSIQLFILEAGLGFAAAMATPTWDALYDEAIKRGHEGSWWGVADGLPKIVTGISILIGGYIVKVYSFNFLFIVMGCLQLVSTAIQGSMLVSKRSR